jgi:hypothetical protein
MSLSKVAGDVETNEKSSNVVEKHVLENSISDAMKNLKID